MSLIYEFSLANRPEITIVISNRRTGSIVKDDSMVTIILKFDISHVYLSTKDHTVHVGGSSGENENSYVFTMYLHTKNDQPTPTLYPRENGPKSEACNSPDKNFFWIRPCSVVTLSGQCALGLGARGQEFPWTPRPAQITFYCADCSLIILHNNRLHCIEPVFLGICKV